MWDQDLVPSSALKTQALTVTINPKDDGSVKKPAANVSGTVHRARSWILAKRWGYESFAIRQQQDRLQFYTFHTSESELSY